MSEAEWRDGDDPKLRALLGYALRDHVRYQDGRHSEAPALLFADYDFEVGDGTCGVAEDGKRCNEPAIVYARADALMDAIDRAEKAESVALTAYARGVDDAARHIEAVMYPNAERAKIVEGIRALAPDPEDSGSKESTE